MEEIIGRIEKKAEGQAKTGAKFLTYTIDGKNYNTFEEKFFDFNVGEIVKVGLEQNGKYKNVVSMEEVLNEKISSTQITTTGTIINETEGISEVKHIYQDSYEFGPAGNRHTIKYFTIEELKAKLEFISKLEVPQFE